MQLHVTAGETLSEEPGYVQTRPPLETAQDRREVVYALDCEMCYTTVGLQLTRVSVVDLNLDPIYESLVKPSHTIVDYNTRYVFTRPCNQVWVWLFCRPCSQLWVWLFCKPYNQVWV